MSDKKPDQTNHISLTISDYTRTHIRLDKDGNEYTTETIIPTHTRYVKAREFICAYPKCPYCHNEARLGSIKQMFCCRKAKGAYQKIVRAQKAIKEGRIPGKPGNPHKKSKS